MHLDGLKLLNFRNYKSLELKGFSPGINFIWGKNAQGKTNLVESVYMCAQGKSFRTPQDSKTIAEGEDKAYIKASYYAEKKLNSLETLLERQKPKSYKKNGMPLKNTKELLGNLLAVVFSPEDIRTVKEAPQLRRSLLDGEISKIRPSYVEALKNYGTILANKKILLREPNSYTEGMLKAYNAKLKDYISVIVKNRTSYANKLNEYMSGTHAMLSDNGEEVKVIYRPTIALDSIEEQLNDLIGREIAEGAIIKGPHRDGLDIILNGREAKDFASQGQLRTLMLALKIACLKILEDNSYSRPILLLDDVFSELDSVRRHNLTDALSGIQTFITSCDTKKDLGLKPECTIKVDEGNAELVIA